MEQTYLQGIRRVFRGLRKEQRAFTTLLAESRSHFLRFLQRPDSQGQEKLDRFVDEFNRAHPDLRKDVAFKEEMHKRIDDLRAALFDLSDKRRKEDEAECKVGLLAWRNVHV